MEIELLVNRDGGDLRAIATVNWPAIPRIGETVQLFGRRFGDDPREKEGVSLFEVIDVLWDWSDGNSEGGVSVVLARPRAESSFTPWCTCSYQRRDPGDPEHCGACGNRLRAAPRTPAGEGGG